MISNFESDDPIEYTETCKAGYIHNNESISKKLISTNFQLVKLNFNLNQFSGIIKDYVFYLIKIFYEMIVNLRKEN